MGIEHLKAVHNPNTDHKPDCQRQLAAHSNFP